MSKKQAEVTDETDSDWYGNIHYTYSINLGNQICFEEVLVECVDKQRIFLQHCQGQGSVAHVGSPTLT